MKSKSTIGVVCGAAALAMSMHAQASTTLNFGGNIELDTDYVNNVDGTSDSDSNMGGRVKLTASAKHETDKGYVLGVGQLILGRDGETGVDDVYIRFGRDNWGLQFGRFEAINLFNLGVDTVHPVIGETNFYQANNVRGRASGDTGQIMYDVSSGNLKFELATIWGEDDDAGGDDNGISGFRPALVYSLTDDLNFTLGYDSFESGATEITGTALYVRYATDDFALKMNYTSGESKTGGATDWENSSANVNFESGKFSIGYTDTSDDGGDSASTIYSNYTIPAPMGVERAQVKLAFAASEADSLPETQHTFRVRFYYEF